MDMLRASYYAQRFGCESTPKNVWRVCRTCWRQRYSGIGFPLGTEPVRCPLLLLLLDFLLLRPPFSRQQILNDVGKVPATLERTRKTLTEPARLRDGHSGSRSSELGT